MFMNLCELGGGGGGDVYMLSDFFESFPFKLRMFVVTIRHYSAMSV